MQLHGRFGRDTGNKKSEESWNSPRHGNLKGKTESLLSAAQEQVLNTKLN